MLIASKHEELDENITQIKDLLRFVTRFMLPNSLSAPTFTEVVECERLLMNECFKWNLKMVTPYQILTLLLANGVVFDNEGAFAKPE